MSYKGRVVRLHWKARPVSRRERRRASRRTTLTIGSGLTPGVTSRVAIRDLDRLNGDRGKHRQKAIGFGMDCIAILRQFHRKILENAPKFRRRRL